MNLRTIGIIISREYQNKVRKKSFLVTTFLVPVLMAALCIVPMVLMMTSKEKTKVIAVIDNSGIVRSYLEDTQTIDYVDCELPLDEAKARMGELGYNAVLNISELDKEAKTVTAEVTSVNPLGLDMVSSINRRINDAVEDYRVASYNIAGLEQILKDVKANVSLKTYTMDEEGKETISETGVFAAASMVLGLLVFLFITLFGSMVMSAVIEEKSSRVVEVLVSSVKATELMFGKIVGIALVALTQFVLWILLTGALVGGAAAIMGPEMLSSVSDVTAMTEMAGVDAEEITAAMGESSEIGVILGTLRNMNLPRLLGVFLLFFVFGYVLYASMFAAIGSAVENEGETNQLQLPLTIPLMIAYFIAIYTFNAPDSPIAFWGSMIPFTSPIVMLARLPFGVPGWELVLSLVLLAVTCVAMAWLSAKIYRVGILMFGKKASWKDLWKWLKQD